MKKYYLIWDGSFEVTEGYGTPKEDEQQYAQIFYDELEAYKKALKDKTEDAKRWEDLHSSSSYNNEVKYLKLLYKYEPEKVHLQRKSFQKAVTEATNGEVILYT